jgi:hypothetical protein
MHSYMGRDSPALHAPGARIVAENVMKPASAALLTDFYQLTMGHTYFQLV